MKPTSAWRVAVSGEADRLAAQLATVTATAGESPGVTAAAATAKDAIDRAQTVASMPPGLRLRDWWSGSSVEDAWQSLHLASEQIMAMMPADALRAQAPNLRTMVQLSSLSSGPAGLAGSPGPPAAPPSPLEAQQLLQAHHAATDATHQQIRSTRNVSVLLLGALAVLDAALWAAGVTSGAVIGLGALAGALSVVFAMRAGSPPGPYNVLPVQAMLKIASGAATALMAVKILDFVSGGTPSTARDSMYAVLFGFSQQAFTRLVDEQVGALAKRAAPRTAMAALPPGAGRPAP